MVWLIRPSDGCIKTLKVIPTATVLTSTGKNTIDRSGVLSLILDVNKTASSSPKTTLRPLVTTAYMTVFVMLPSRAGRLKKRTKLSQPDELPVKEGPSGEAEEEGHRGGDDEEHRIHHRGRDIEGMGVRAVPQRTCTGTSTPGVENRRGSTAPPVRELSTSEIGSVC